MPQIFILVDMEYIVIFHRFHNFIVKCFCDDLVWITYFIVRNNAFGIGKAVKGNVNNQFVTDVFFT